MRGAAGDIAVGEKERLVTLVWYPTVLECNSVPICLKEEVRHVDKSIRTILLAVDSVTWENHVVFMVCQALGGIIAGWEVYILSKGLDLVQDMSASFRDRRKDNYVSCKFEEFQSTGMMHLQN